MNKLPLLVANRLIRLTGNTLKLLSYPVHWVLPRLRFSIPECARAKLKPARPGSIPRIVWQTNFTRRATLPVYLNYLCNRLLSLHCDYRYVSTEARAAYLKEQAGADIYDAYARLTDGAAQADLWRLFVLWQKGGVYIDIDATIVWNLNTLLGDRDALFVRRFGRNTKFTNYFIAAAPGNPDLRRAIDQVVKNINTYAGEGVYGCTGPAVLHEMFKDRDDVPVEDRKYVCIQGVFTNEYFQYLDHPGKKWIHIDPDDLVETAHGQTE